MALPQGPRIAALLLALCCVAAGRAAAAEPGAWVGTWATAVHAADGVQMGGVTLRQVARVSLGGERLRLRFSNEFGAAPLRIGAASVALAAAKGAVRPGSERPLRFNGGDSALIAAGATLYSDPVDFELPAFADLAVTLYLPPQQMAGVSFHGAARQTSYLALGRHPDAASLPRAQEQTSSYFLSAVEVDNAPLPARPPRRAIVTLGDSITDGYGVAPDSNRRWPDLLARRLAADPRTAMLGVLNLSIGGGRLLTAGNGPSAVSRLEREVLAQNGVSQMIVLVGINDLGAYGRPHAPAEEVAAEDLIGGYRRLIELAHARGIRIIGGTLLPYEGAGYHTARGEALRQAVNRWIRESGEFDAVIDFDAALRDPQRPGALAKAYDGGDHLHPGDAGMQALAAAVPLDLLVPEGSQ